MVARTILRCQRVVVCQLVQVGSRRAPVYLAEILVLHHYDQDVVERSVAGERGGVEACWESTNVLHSRCLRGEQGTREDRKAEKENCEPDEVDPRVRV